MKTPYSIILTLSLLTFLSSCDKNQVQAEKLLQGTWTVTSITTQYGEFFNNTFEESISKSETGTLGTFEFGENNVSYNFTADGKSYQNESSRQLNYEKVNSGFIRVPQYILEIGNDFSFNPTCQKSLSKHAEH